MTAQTAAPRQAYVTRTASGISFTIYSATGTTCVKRGHARTDAQLTARLANWGAEIVLDQTV